MKLSYHWLKDYLALPADPQTVADLITQHVAEVEQVNDQATALTNVVVGKIIELLPHPKADRLMLCQVKLGEEIKNIVCGGTNLVKGQLVAVAKPGARVRWHGKDEMTTIVETTIRGEQSTGMICAASELELEGLFPQQSEREIIDLSHLTHPTGTALAEALGLTDTIITIANKTLTHRPDLFSHIGFARELSVLLDTPLKLPALKAYAAGDTLPYAVHIKANEQCRRYLGVVVDHVTVKPSPDWLQQRLRAIGVRPINNVVDITNYVMYEYGQPLHAFDYAKLVGQQVTIRLAKSGETITTLDGAERKLTDQMLVIADQTKPVALAGAMGGKASEITEQTTTVAIESANFNPTTIRLGAQSLGLRSDASTRHEKNLPLVLAEQGLYRALELLEELAAGQVASRIIDERTTVETNPAISLDCSYVQRLIGVAIKPDKIKTILTKLGCQISGATTLQVIPPPHRTDLTIPEELIEEVARIYGYNVITPQPLLGQLEPQPIEPTWQLAQQLTQKAVEAGCMEVYNYSFYAEAKGDSGHIRLLNPMNPEQVLLRQNLRTNLLAVAERNLDRGERDLNLVEYGHVYVSAGEQNHLAVQCVGNSVAVYRRAKGFQEIFGCSGELSLDRIGQWYVATLEIDLTNKTIPDVQFVLLPEFPGIELDISVEFPNETAWSEIEKIILEVGKPLVVSVDVFDVYKQAIGIRLKLQCADRTLAMDEAEKIRDTIIQALQKNFNATHRF